jgi:hypothetical protein
MIPARQRGRQHRTESAIPVSPGRNISAEKRRQNIIALLLVALRMRYFIYELTSPKPFATSFWLSWI